MISKISGKIVNIDSQVKSLVIDLNGMGLSVQVSDEKMYSVDQNISLEIYFYWNQENGPQLFGFDSLIAKQVFGLIISCSGIGPKIGMAALGELSPEDIINCIILGDTKALSKISGIGPKKAELIIACVKNKASKLFNNLPKSDNNLVSKLKSASDVLTSLNYTSSEIKSTLDYIKQDEYIKNTPDISLDDILRKSLAFIVKLNNKI